MKEETVNAIRKGLARRGRRSSGGREGGREEDVKEEVSQLVLIVYKQERAKEAKEEAQKAGYDCKKRKIRKRKMVRKAQFFP